MKFSQNTSKEIFKTKYMINNEETPDEVFIGIAKEIASVEAGHKNKEKWENKFYNEISSGRLIPAGRILANARPNARMPYYNNCYTVAIDDSIDDIYDTLKEDANISSTGGGVGLNFSNLRPKDAPLSKGGKSSGVISFMKVFNESAKIIQTGGSRRCLPLWYEVVTPEGNKKITDLIIGDLIILDEHQYKINEFYYNGKQKLIKIGTKNGWHVSTPNHKWYVWNLKTEEMEWVEAQNLEKQGKLSYAFLIPK